MRNGWIAAWALGLAGMLASAPSARAEFFEYTSTVTIDNTPGSFTPAGSSIVNGGNTASLTTPNGNNINLFAQNSNASVPHQNAGGPGTDIVPLEFDANSSFATETLGFNFTLTVTVTDYAGPFDATPSVGLNPNPGTFTFTGRVEGTLGDFQTNLDLISFATPTPTLAIGNATYTISLSGIASPGLDTNGALSLHLTARPVPEPGSIALLGMGGVGALGLFLRRRARA